MELSRIRNFCIIAHIDHGKSTLADRLLEFTHSITVREKKEQFLDNMDIERERGITIKAQTASMKYIAKNGETYLLNLIDTPGHVDFTYEVSRSIASCEGAILVVDASQGVEAQTLANLYMALDFNLEIIPVLNKIDLPAADPQRVKEEIENTIGLDCSEALNISAKNGVNIDLLLEEIVKKVPPPKPSDAKQVKALIFDSWFDPFLGIMVIFRVFSGRIKRTDRIRFVRTGKDYNLVKLGKLTPHQVDIDEIGEGEVGFLAASIKTVGDVKTGDTITLTANPADQPLKGFKEVKPVIFCGIYPVSADDFPALTDSLGKLALNDSSFTFETETSNALGFGYRCGFLGMLHMDIIRERLEREYDLVLLITAPTVIYKVHLTSGEVISIDNPGNLPSIQEISYVEEPMVKGTIYLPDEYVGAIMKLSVEKRGRQITMDYISQKRVCLKYEFPMNEIVIDFYDELKSLTKGYASFDYEISSYAQSDLIKMDILLNGENIDALSLIVHRDKAFQKGKELTRKLKELIPRQMFEIAIQAAIGAKIIARESISAMRKNVTAKCYGGDISRKRKLLEKQKEGKKRMKQFGSVEVPQEAFMAVLKLKS